MAKQRHNPRVARARTRRMDETLAAVSIPALPKTGWIRSVRTALGMTQKQLASRLGNTSQSLGELERQEVVGGITVDTLGRVANALGCDIQYVLVPRDSLANMVEQQAVRRARQKLERVNASQSLEDSALSSTNLNSAVRDLADEMKTERPADLWDGY